jgi:maleate isomerase
VGISKVSVASPFSQEVDAKLREFLEENTIRVMKLERMNQRNVQEYENYAPSVLYTLGKKAFIPESDGVLIPCNQVRAIEIAEELEMDLGKPVVTSVQASLWLALKAIGVKAPVKGHGSLLTRL